MSLDHILSELQIPGCSSTSLVTLRPFGKLRLPDWDHLLSSVPWTRSAFAPRQPELILKPVFASQHFHHRFIAPIISGAFDGAPTSDNNNLCAKGFASTRLSPSLLCQVIIYFRLISRLS